MSGGRLPVAVVLAVFGGLLVVGATSAQWVEVEQVREVGGVELTEAEGIPGVELAPRAVPAGVLGAGAGLVLTVARRRARRPVGLLVLAAGAAAAVLAGTGTVAAIGEPGALTPAPGLAVTGAAGLVAAGTIALRRPAPAPVLGSRYSVEASTGAADDEWGLASDE